MNSKDVKLRVGCEMNITKIASLQAPNKRSSRQSPVTRRISVQKRSKNSGCRARKRCGYTAAIPFFTQYISVAGEYYDLDIKRPP